MTNGKHPATVKGGDESLKYGIAIKIIETDYLEAEADCEKEAKALAGEAAM